jgi:hypothetical protein
MFQPAVEEGQKLVAFYSGVTCVYFPIIMCVLYSANYLYSVGKYSFFPVIGIILVTECSKYLIGTYYLVRRNIPGTGRYDERYLIMPIKKNSTKNRIKEGMKSFLLIIIMTVIYYTIALLFGEQILANMRKLSC